MPLPLLRKYIAYARRYVHPKLGEASKKVHIFIFVLKQAFIKLQQVIQNFYMELRAKPQAEVMPITTRQLESLIRSIWSQLLKSFILPFSRLTEARARMELREEATKEDAEEVITVILKLGKSGDDCSPGP